MKKQTIWILAVLCMATAQLNAQITIIGGTLGNGDFEASEPATGAIPYDQTANWFNAGGAETINFTQDNQTGGSSQANSRAGMPFNNRTQVNDIGYTIGAVGDVFSLSYDFGAGGAPANWDGDEVMRTFLFTTPVPVDGSLTVADITELGGDSYAINRAADGQWTTRTVPNFYTATPADVGQTAYFGMVFDQGGGSTLFPRIDVIHWSVTPVPEPSTWALAALFGGGLLALRRGRRK